MAQFFGKSQRTVDEKGRVIIPANFRTELGEEFFLAQGKTNQLAIYTTDDWKAYFEQYANADEENDDAALRELDRADTVMSIRCDVQGRICIPEDYRDYADIKSEVTVIGIQNRIEIWNVDRYKKRLLEAKARKSNLKPVE